MITIKGFMQFHERTNNTKGVVAPIGELSPIGRTYTTSLAEYRSPLNKDRTYLSIHTSNDAAVPNNLLDEIFEVTQKVTDYLATNTGVFDESLLKSYLEAEVGVSAIGVGDMVYDSAFRFLEWLSWTSPLQGLIRVWYANEAFLTQYDGFSIKVIPQLPLVKYSNTRQALLTDLSNSSIADMLVQSVTERSQYPETATRIVPTPLHPKDGGEPLVVNWLLMVYGRQGDHLDAYKDAIISYIAANSQEAISEWEQRLPYVYQRTEFLFFPSWDNIAIPSLTDLTALNSTIINVEEEMVRVSALYPDYTAPLVRSNAGFISFPHRWLTSLVLPGKSNPGDIRKLKDLFSDYLPVSTLSGEFTKMSTKTQSWVLAMQKLFQVAEDNKKDLIENQFRITRNGKTYAMTTFLGVNYLIKTRLDNE